MLLTDRSAGVADADAGNYPGRIVAGCQGDEGISHELSMRIETWEPAPAQAQVDADFAGEAA